MIPNPAWHDPATFYFNHLLENFFEHIQREAFALRERGKFEPHVQSDESTVANKFKLANHWNVYRFKINKSWVANDEDAPITSRLLRSIPEIMKCPVGLAYFSEVPGDSTVRPHISNYAINDRIRHQLCLELPDARPEDEVFIRVNGEKRTWELGKVLTFDDAYRHDVRNSSPHRRLVLLYDSLPV